MFEVIYAVEFPKHAMDFKISEIIRLTEGLVLFPGFHRGNKHTVLPVRRCSVFANDVSIRPIYSSSGCSGVDDERERNKQGSICKTHDGRLPDWRDF